MRRNASLIFFCLIFFSFGLVAQENNLYTKADKYFELKDFDAATKQYKKILNYDPEDSHSLWKLGDIEWLSYNYDEAYTYYGIASGLKWKSNEHIRRYIEVLLLKSEYSNALKWAMNMESKEANLGGYLIRKIKFAKKHINDPATYELEYHVVNTASAEFGATYIAENYLVYSSARSDIKRVFKSKGVDAWAGKSMNQLYVAPVKTGQSFDQPLFYRSDLENNFNEGPIGVSDNGEWVVVTKNNFLDGISQVYSPGIEMSLYIGKLNEKGSWRDLKPFQYNIQGYATGMASLHDEGKTMYFASNRPDGFGGFDIYVSFKEEGKWSFPKNLGPTVNTPGNEVSPYYNNGELFFSSDLHPGYGGLDTYRASFNIEGIVDRVYHLGNAINSKYDDYYLVYNNELETGFVTSNRRVDFSEDIYVVKGLGKRIVIRVLDAKSNESLSNAKVSFKDCGLQDLMTDGQGETSIRMMSDIKCVISITKEGYGIIEIPFDSKKRNYWEIALYPSLDIGKTAGFILNENNIPFPKVYIKAINEDTGFYEERVSDADGKYSITLDPNTNYSIEFLKAGYISRIMKLRTGGLKSQELSVITLEKTPIIGVEKSNNIVKTLNVAMIEKSGYALQLGSFSDLGSIDLSKYANIQDLGNIYSVELDGAYKVRLGLYNDISTADNIKKILKIRGLKGAFTVAQNIHDNIPAKNVSTSTVVDGKSRNILKTYVIKLGAFKQPKWFDISNARKLGVINQYQKGEFTVFVVDNLSDLDNAKSVLRDARKGEYKDAYIMILGDDGEYIKF